jgi:putative transposase
MRQSYPIVLMCQVLDVSESGFHARSSRPLSKRNRENARLEIEILAAHHRTRETCSAKRLYHDLADHGVQTTPYRVRTLRKKLNLRCKQKLKFKVTTDSRHNLPVAPNILNREFTVKAPGKVWVSDITYISTDEGWLYLAGVKDLFNGKLAGYAMNDRMTRHLVIQALFRATASKHPDEGLIAASDWRTQVRRVSGKPRAIHKLV